MKNKWFFRGIVLFYFIFILGTGWYFVFQQKETLINTNIIAYQETELEIVKITAHGIKNYIHDQTENHGRTDLSNIEAEVYVKFVEPIHLAENGNAWVYAPDQVIFGPSDDFPDAYRGKSMAEIFEMQKLKGASHFSEMTAAVTEAREGVGWYIWLPEKGKEIAAWTPLRVDDYIWTVGLSTPLSEILESTGAKKQIEFLNTLGWLNSFLLSSIYILWLFSTIKQEKSAKKIRESEMRYRNIFNSAPDGVSILDRKGTILECSQSTAKLYGYSSPKELIGKNLAELMSTDSLKVFKQKMHLLQNLESAEGEIKILRPDGSLVDIWRKGHPLMDAQGNFSGILGFDRDISERVQVESEYKKLHQAVEQSANSIVITDVDGAIEYVNPKFLQVSGYRESEVLGENSRFLKSGKHAQTHYENLWQTIKSGKEWHGEFCNKRKDDSLYWEKVTIAPVFDNEKKIINFIAIKEDITQQIYIEQELKKTYKKLENQVKERTAELERANDLLQERIIEINTLYQVMARATLSMHLDDILQHTLNAINETIKPDNIAILLIEEDTKDLVIRAYSGFGDGPKLMRRKLGVGIPGIVAQTGETIVLPDVRKHESYHACDDGALSEICVPLKIGGQVLGSLNLENQELDSFSENDLRMLIILANNLSIIIKNSQLYEDTARLKRFNENIVQGVTESILVENADGYFTFVNPALEKLLGYSQDELLGHHWTKIVPKYAVEQILHEMAAPRKEHQRQYETVIQNKAGEIIPILVSARSFFESEIYTGALSILTNIAERVQMEEKLHQQATTDPLTKVFNRRYFFDLAQQELERSQRYDRPLSIIIFDIDHFKKVNDTHGHAVGDEVLRQLSERCQKTLRENDILARYGGEEFIILLPETPQEQAKQMAERMRINCAETPFNNELAPVKLTISFGLSSFAPTLPLDELLLRADKALYLAKEGGRNRVSVWEVEK